MKSPTAGQLFNWELADGHRGHLGFKLRSVYSTFAELSSKRTQFAWAFDVVVSMRS